MTQAVFPGLPAIGTFLRLRGGQVFTCVGFEPCRRQDGQPAELSIWSTTCQSCGGSFAVTASWAKGGTLSGQRCSSCGAR